MDLDCYVCFGVFWSSKQRRNEECTIILLMIWIFTLLFCLLWMWSLLGREELYRKSSGGMYHNSSDDLDFYISFLFVVDVVSSRQRRIVP